MGCCLPSRTRTALSAGSACAPGKIWSSHTVLWVLSLLVATSAWYSLRFSGLRHLGITSLMLAGELWWQTERLVLRKNQLTNEFSPPSNELWRGQKHSLCFDPYMFEQTRVQVADKNLPEGSAVQRRMIWLHPTLPPQSKANCFCIKSAKWQGSVASANK